MIDLGVARATDTDVQLTTMVTRTGVIMGPIAYMSPEQLGGERDDVDLRSDVYALGALLFQLLTGALPLDVVKLPLHEAARRYPSAVALVDDLGRWLGCEPIEARPPSVTDQARLFARRHRALLASLIVITVASLSTAVISWRSSGRCD